jgi:hypothetical protein
MGDYDSVDLIGWDVLQQSRQGRVSHVEYESKVILLNQKAAARLTCGGPSSARPRTVILTVSVLLSWEGTVGGRSRSRFTKSGLRSRSPPLSHNHPG